MRAHARIVAEPGPAGTRLTTLRGEPPLLPRRTGPAGSDIAEVHLVGAAAGPLGGDHLQLDIVVHPGARLTLRTTAATLALPSRPASVSRTIVTAHVAAGATLRYLPEQLIAGAGCRHEAVSTVDVEAGGFLTWREELVCGRHGEQSGDATLTLNIGYGRRPLLRQILSVGPHAPGWAAAGVLGGARATGALLHIDPTAEPGSPTVLGPTAVRVPLNGPANLTTATAPNTHTLRQYLAAAALNAHAYP
jgi:urease accessory protein